MPETLFIKDFSGGWQPSNDAVNGSPNGLLQMDNVELDENGAIALIGGTSVKQAGFPSAAHTLFSRYQNGTRNDYSALANGAIYRDSTSIATGGNSSNAGFGTAFNFTLICSGNTRKKDTGTGTPVNLGVGAPTVAPIVIQAGIQFDTPLINYGSLVSNNITTPGTSAVVTATNYNSGHVRPSPIKYLQVTTDATTGQAVVQTNSVSGSVDLTNFPDTSGAGNGTSTDDDIFYLYGYTTYPWGCSLKLDILCDTPNAFGDQVQDYFSFTIQDLATTQFDPSTGVFILAIKRSDFLPYGSTNWAAIWGYRITFTGQPGQVVNLLGSNNNPTSALGGAAMFVIGGSNSQNGVYQFVQVNVNNTGSYLAKSILGPACNAITAIGEQVVITPQTPTDPQVNEVWIFARSTGGTNPVGVSSTLGQWYRVARQTTSLGSNITILLGDQGALNLNITFNLNLVSASSSGITDKIFDIVGPIEGRWFYFTTNFMYPSDINDPDLVDTSLAVRTCGSNNELFMWARAISASVVLVGTSNNVYLLTGTFATLADGSIDVYYQPEGITKFPPITYDAEVYEGAVYYMANDGWRIVTATSFGTTYSSASNSLIVAPFSDRLYKGQTCYGYQPPILKIAPGSVRFPITIARNKLWCFITGTGRVEVYDFTRKYWRTFNYNLGDASAVTCTQDGQVLAFYTNDSKTREIGIASSKLIDGTNKQTFNILLPFMDNGKPRQRKDVYTFKTRSYTGASSSYQLQITNEKNITSVIPTSVQQQINASIESFVDLSQVNNVQLSKSLQLKLSGTVDDLLIEDLSIDFDARPVPLTFLRIQPSNYENPSKKRARVWPFEIDTLGQNVICTPNVDGVNYVSPTVFNTSFKQTVYHFFNTDVFGTDYGCTLYDPSGLMEVWNVLTPDFVQTLPIPRQFDQIGPQEFTRWGKCVKMGLRVLAYGSVIPWVIYFSDGSLLQGVFNTSAGVEDTYYVDFPKGIGGRILRFTLGPTNFNFHRYYMRFWVNQSGGQENTEMQIITIPGGMLG